MRGHLYLDWSMPSAMIVMTEVAMDEVSILRRADSQCPCLNSRIVSRGEYSKETDRCDKLRTNGPVTQEVLLSKESLR